MSVCPIRVHTCRGLGGASSPPRAVDDFGAIVRNSKLAIELRLVLLGKSLVPQQ